MKIHSSSKNAVVVAEAAPGPVTKSGSVYTPAFNAVERKAITQALSTEVEKVLKQKTSFVSVKFNISGDFAFLRGMPQQPNNKPIDYSKTPYQSQIDQGAFDDGFSALVKFERGAWKVVAWDIGSTDVAWAGWSEQYRAPAGIFI